MNDKLLVGAGEVDITPPVGTALAGWLNPRISEGIQDPLMIKAVVLEAGGKKLVYVMLDLIALSRKTGDVAVKLASERTGIPEQNIVWAASYTHSGPYTGNVFDTPESVNRTWLKALPETFAECVAKADAAKRPVRFSRCRAFQAELSSNRRMLFKNGQAVNTWNLDRAPADIQCLSSAGPIDPEIGMLAFDDLDGNLQAVIFQFTLHANTNFGRYFSGDYPAVVAARLRERFGPQVVTLFVPGACADINRAGHLTYRQVGDALAEQMIPVLKKRIPVHGPVRLEAMKREVIVPFRDFTQDQEERIKQSGWSVEDQQIFRRELEIMRREGITETKTVLQAWRIGEVGFASLPGELFVDWGIKIKRESQFSWTYPVELGGDYLGYLITEQAWEAGGYEALIARSSKPSPAGVSLMVDNVLEMLGKLYMTDRK